MNVQPARPGEVVVGIIANPRSGHDIRRLVARASVFPSAEKVSMLQRVLGSLGALGVHRVVSMTDRGGVSDGLGRAVDAHRPDRDPPWPTVEFLDLPFTGSAGDSILAARTMVGLGVRLLVVLGGDGTARVVASACGDVPMVALSTGTNNTFAQLGEATVAGLAAGLVATGHVSRTDGCRCNKMLRVEQGERSELALVDVAVLRMSGTGARAVWDENALTELFVTFAEPDAIGLSSIAGLVQPVDRDEPFGLHLRIDTGAERHVLAPIAPGLVRRVGVASVDELVPGRSAVVADGVLAIDGERELEATAAPVRITLSLDGPWSVDVARTLAVAAERGLLARSS